MFLRPLSHHQTRFARVPLQHVRFNSRGGFWSGLYQGRRARLEPRIGRQNAVARKNQNAAIHLSGPLPGPSFLRACFLHFAANIHSSANIPLPLATTSRSFATVSDGLQVASAGQGQMADVDITGGDGIGLEGEQTPCLGGESVIPDPELHEDVPVEPEELNDAVSRPPPVDSDYLPLPWKGRLGYACLNTYLRYSTPPVFCSRTCRIASILENRHPLQDGSQPPHPTKNRPDRTKPADVVRGQKYVESLGLANARDAAKIIRWNERFGIKFMRLSSEMFPFASHKEYGYRLKPFASGVLAEAGRVIAELGHRVSVHPGQFTQLGTPRKEVVESSIRDLEYHSEMLQLLKLPPQHDRDAVMILHMGGVFGDKEATLDRFRENYKGLSKDIKNRLVLENDDVSWSVHDLLPICEELNIPLVLDYHHHNIIFDSTQVREGTLDIMSLYDRIRATWTRKGITQKMHYSEPQPSAITKRDRRKHRDRVVMLPPCDPTMDLMIEAKDKEQAVFELMRIYKLPGYNLFSDMVPHCRADENKPFKPPKTSRKSAKEDGGFVDLDSRIPPPPTVSDEEVGMGGPNGRVYWPPGMEEWLRPAKRIVQARSMRGAGKASATKKNENHVETLQGNGELANGAPETPQGNGVLANSVPETPTPKSSRQVRKRKASPVISASASDDESVDYSALPDVTPSRFAAVRRSRRVRKINYAEESDSA